MSLMTVRIELGRTADAPAGNARHGYEFVALLARFHERHVQADFEFLGNHLSFRNLSFLPLRTAAGADVGARCRSPVRPWSRPPRR